MCSSETLIFERIVRNRESTTRLMSCIAADDLTYRSSLFEGDAALWTADPFHLIIGLCRAGGFCKREGLA